jgi:hypothetical protein
MPRYFSYCFFSFFIIAPLTQSNLLQAQELEARLLSNIPVKSNVLAVGYGYARSIKFFGMSGKFDIAVPFSTADWSGTYQGNYEESSQTGFGDIRIGLWRQTKCKWSEKRGHHFILYFWNKAK